MGLDPSYLDHEAQIRTTELRDPNFRTYQQNSYVTFFPDVGFITRKALTATKPDIHVEVNGDHYVITTIATLKTIKADFKLGQTFKLDPGTGREATVKRSSLFMLAG